MANIEGYLRWRGDLSMNIDPFNEVDNLVLAQLSYVDFDGIVPEDNETWIPIREVRDRYWQIHTEEEISKRQSFVKLSPFLLGLVAGTERFGNMKLAGYVNHVSQKEEAQMSAVQYLLDDGTIYVAFRGTDETLVGWKEDFNLSFSTETEGQRLALDYLKRYFSNTSKRLRVGGHSKGGNFAIYASAFAGPEVLHQIETVYTNDGPGFREEVLNRPEYRLVMERTISIIPQGSIIGMLLGTKRSHRVVGSCARGIMQHDAMSWNVLGNRFVTAERSRDSIFMEKTLSRWLDGIDDEEREMFVDQLFAFMEASGARTMKEMRDSSLKEIKSILRMAKDLPWQRQKEFMDIVLQLFKTGSETLQDTISEGIEAKRLERERLGNKQDESDEPEDDDDTLTGEILPQ